MPAETAIGYTQFHTALSFLCGAGFSKARKYQSLQRRLALSVAISALGWHDG
jgi:hypothetical protein